MSKLRTTDSELEILEILWETGTATVRQVNEELEQKGKNVSYTTTLKMMQIMTEKGLVIRDERQMKHVYSPAAEEGKTKGFLLNRFVETMYNGSASSLMMQLLGNKNTSKKELDAIKELIKKIDQQG